MFNNKKIAELTGRIDLLERRLKAQKDDVNDRFECIWTQVNTPADHNDLYYSSDRSTLYGKVIALAEHLGVDFAYDPNAVVKTNKKEKK